MRQVAIVFTVTGNKPREGHRFQELLAIEVSDGILTGARLHQRFKFTEKESRHSFSDQFQELDVFIGTSKIIVHDAGMWRRFLRVELPNIKDRNARRLMNDIDDVARWAHQRFPKQRKALVSLGRRLNIVISTTAIGLARDAEILVGIAGKMTDSDLQATAISSKSTSTKTIYQTFRERLRLCWLAVIRHA